MFINGADVRMIKSRSGAGFTAEAFESERVAGHIISSGRNLRATKRPSSVPSALWTTPHAAAQLFNNFAMGDGLSNEGLGLDHVAAHLMFCRNSSLNRHEQARFEDAADRV